MNGAQPNIELASFQTIGPINEFEASNVEVLLPGCNNPVDYARKVEGYPIKIVGAMIGGQAHVAIGFGSDQHSEIAEEAFSAAIRDKWSSEDSELGGGKVEIDLTAGTVTISGSATSLDQSPFPKQLEALAISEIRRLINA